MLKMVHQFGLAIDQMLNVFFYSSHDKKHHGYGFGYADETISARSWRLREKSKFWNVMCVSLDFILFYDNGEHCYRSYMNEFKKHQLPPHYKSVEYDN